MPRFFNRIRKQLAKDNKFFQYSRYAIGEILLVVIGILIALQINNWNEEVNNLRVERGFYEDILNDFKKDSLKLEGLTIFYKNRIEQAGWLLGKIRSPEGNVDAEEIGKRIQPLYIGPLSVSYNATYEAAKSSGAFANFRNKDVLKNLNQFYADIEELNGILEATMRWLESSLEPMMSKYPENYMTEESGVYMITSELDDLKEFYEFVSAIKDKRNLPINLRDILDRPEFEYYLTGELGRSFNALGSIDRRMMRLDDLKEEIISYINILSE
ncbi:MAG: DUF6090 family protein [Crocinitomicaceae bacterium]|jgi:hypothetical protein